MPSQQAGSMEITDVNATSFRSSDFVTIAVLVLRKHRLLRTIRDDPKRVVFEFERTPELETDIEHLRLGTLLVDPAAYWTAERRVKQLIYEGARQ